MTELFKENKNFRVLLVYQVFSGLGGGIFSLFMLLSVHLIYQRPIFTGIAGFLITLPLVFSFAVGPVVDRKPKVKIMRITTLLEFAVLSLLVFVPFRDGPGVLFLFAVVFVYALAALFEAPASTALLPQIVAEEKIMQANSLMQIAGLVGGLIIAALLFGILGGTDMDFRTIYGMSAGFLALAFVSSLFLKEPDGKREKKPNYWADLKNGVKFLRQSVLLFILIIVSARVFFAEIAYINMPMFAETHVGAQGYVVLTVTMLLGGLIASSLMGTLGGKFRVGRLLFSLAVLAGAARIFFAFVLPQSYHGGIFIIVIYATLISASALVVQSLLQKIPPKDMVGRIDTLVTTGAAVFVTVGALVGGFLGSVVPDVAHIFMYQGGALIIIGVLTLAAPGMRALSTMEGIGKQEDS